MRLLRRRKAAETPSTGPRLSVGAVRGMLARRVTSRLLKHPVAPAVVLLLVVTTFMAVQVGAVLAAAIGGVPSA